MIKLNYSQNGATSSPFEKSAPHEMSIPTQLLSIHNTHIIKSIFNGYWVVPLIFTAFLL
jgi:hypothetical protein